MMEWKITYLTWNEMEILSEHVLASSKENAEKIAVDRATELDGCRLVDVSLIEKSIIIWN